MLRDLCGCDKCCQDIAVFSVHRLLASWRRMDAFPIVKWEEVTEKEPGLVGSWTCGHCRAWWLFVAQSWSLPCWSILFLPPPPTPPPPVLELGQEGSFHSGNHFHSINWMKTKVGAMPCGYCFTSGRRGLNFRLPGRQGHTRGWSTQRELSLEASCSQPPFWWT